MLQKTSQFLNLCAILLITGLHVNKTTQTINRNPLEVNLPPKYLTEDLPEMLLHIFLDSYIETANTIVIFPGCTLTPSIDIQSDILDSLLVQVSEHFVLDIQRDFERYKPGAVSFLWLVDSKEAVRWVTKQSFKIII